MNNHAEQQHAFMQLLKPIQRNLEAYCLRLTHDRDEARDLMQDTIVLVWQNFDSLRDHTAFKSFCFTVATNAFRRRHSRRRLFGLLPDDHDEESNDPTPEQRTDHMLLHEALQKLPERSREAILLFELADMSVADIQRIQGGTASGVKVRLMRARRRLQELLGVTPSNTASLEHSYEAN
jgi:RNA polymerase sigma-70 factor (ECF subfamily)